MLGVSVNLMVLQWVAAGVGSHTLPQPLEGALVESLRRVASVPTQPNRAARNWRPLARCIVMPGTVPGFGSTPAAGVTALTPDRSIALLALPNCSLDRTKAAISRSRCWTKYYLRKGAGRPERIVHAAEERLTGLASSSP